MFEIEYGEEITRRKKYAGEVIGTINELEKEQFTEKQFILKEIIEALGVVTSGTTNDLALRIQVDKRGRYKLTQRWRVQ